MEQQQDSYYDSGHTTTFINSNNENLNGYMFPKQLKLKDGNVIELNELIIDYIKKTNHKSQFSDERFIYNKNLTIVFCSSVSPVPSRTSVVFGLL